MASLPIRQPYRQQSRQMSTDPHNELYACPATFPYNPHGFGLALECHAFGALMTSFTFQLTRLAIIEAKR